MEEDSNMRREIQDTTRHVSVDIRHATLGTARKRDTFVKDDLRSRQGGHEKATIPPRVESATKGRLPSK